MAEHVAKLEAGDYALYWDCSCGGPIEHTAGDDKTVIVRCTVADRPILIATMTDDVYEIMTPKET